MVDKDRTAVPSSASLWNALEAFLQEHRRCGALDTGVENGRVWMTCECGAGLCHWLCAAARRTRRHAPGSAMLHSAQPVRRVPAWTRPVCSKPVSDHSPLTRRTLARGPSDGAA